ncbi:MAG: hypothetical protein RR340_11980 [Cloacibacillus sp.]
MPPSRGHDLKQFVVQIAGHWLTGGDAGRNQRDEYIGRQVIIISLRVDIYTGAERMKDRSVVAIDGVGTCRRPDDVTRFVPWSLPLVDKIR